MHSFGFEILCFSSYFDNDEKNGITVHHVIDDGKIKKKQNKQVWTIMNGTCLQKTIDYVIDKQLLKCYKRKSNCEHFSAIVFF